MLDYLARFFREFYILFIEMAPFLLLGMTVAGLMSVFIKKELVVRHVGHNGLGSVFKAALLGVPLPLCSCGVVPTASYLKKYGASRPAVMSFLISTPQTGVDSLTATWGMLGPLFAVFRATTALITGLVGGAVSWIFDKEARIEDDSDNIEVNPIPEDWQGKLKHFLNFAYRESVDDIALNFLVGLAVAALISLIIPAGFFEETLLSNGILSMLLMVAIGVPMYVCSTSSIPIAVALILKGLSPGAAYVFLVAGPATNAATISILMRILGKKQTAFYVGTIVVGSLVFGLLMEAVTTATSWQFAGSVMDHGLVFGVMDYILAVVFAGLLLYSLAGRFGLTRLWQSRNVEQSKAPDGCGCSTGDAACGCSTGDGCNCSNKDSQKEEGDKDMENKTEISTITLNVEGMTCNHCKATVSDALGSVEGADDVQVDLSAKQATVTGSALRTDLEKAIAEAGYKVG